MLPRPGAREQGSDLQSKVEDPVSALPKESRTQQTSLPASSLTLSPKQGSCDANFLSLLVWFDWGIESWFSDYSGRSL